MALRSLALLFAACAAAACPAACATKPDLPLVQVGAAAPPNAIVAITGSGWGSPCAVIDVGETVEWRNLQPGIAANVTSLGGDELYSPSLVEGGQMAEEYSKKAKKIERFAYWRHTFAKPGIYEYFDTNRGDPGRKVVDPYYGKVTFVGVASNVDTGVVCVQAAGSDQCTAVCCVKDNNGDPTLGQLECTPNNCCDYKGKRCLEGAPTNPICQPNIGAVGQAAFRNFKCFQDSDCPAGKVCAVNMAVNHSCVEK